MVGIEQTRAWVEVDLDALRQNFRTVRAAIGPRPAIIAMVKADAYGLGAARVVRALEPLEPWAYGVATADEGAALRELGVRRPILVFGPLPPRAVPLAARARMTATISDLPSLDRWVAAATESPLDFHVEIDTGMGRAGFDWRDTPQWSAAVRQRVGDAVRWTGAMTHFHGADSADATATAAQWERFQDALKQLPVSREDLLVHAANSAAALRWPEYAADAVRPGIFLYGGNPALEGGAPSPQPVVAVRARLALIREVPPGSTVGYGATHVARRWERWGTLAIGYGDGLPRRLGNRGSAIIRGRVVPFVGRISMDLTVVDITGVPEAAVGDAVTLIGADHGAEILLDDVAALAETISYEILTGLRPRLPRVEKDSWTGPD
ncbi:MAG TPA: alanine racemase [Longimicrobiales bacterium]|nr:alanine racemase [Longimicrobiales bacterium]